MDTNKDNILDSLQAWPNCGLKKLLLWHNWRKTALIFFIMLILLLDIAANSIISVASVVGILLLLASLSYWSFVWGMRKLRKSNIIENPYQSYIEIDLQISEEAAVQLTRLFVFKLNPIVKRLYLLFLVDDFLDSLKFLLLLGVLNIVGDYTNGISVIIVGFILIFTLPKFYACKKPFIDMQIQHFQRLKNHLLCAQKMPLSTSTATVDPQVLLSKQLQKTNDEDIEISEQIVYSEYTNEYNWQQGDTPNQNTQHNKEQ